MEDSRLYLAVDENGNLVIRKELVQTASFGWKFLLVLAVVAAMMIWLVNKADLNYIDASVTNIADDISGENYGGKADTMSDANCPFFVMVSDDDLNIREGAGTDTAKTGKYAEIGIYTIVQVKKGPGADLGWGKLESGAGWISLDYVKLVTY